MAVSAFICGSETGTLSKAGKKEDTGYRNEIAKIDKRMHPFR